MSGNTPILSDVYDVQITEATVKVGKKEGAQPTLRCTCEIINPPSVVVAGRTYATAGRKFFMMPNSIDPSLGYGLGQIQAGLEKSKFDFTKFNPEGELDTDMFVALVGHKMSMALCSKEEFYTRPATAGETPEVDVNGEACIFLKDPKTGEKLSKGHFIVNNRGQSPGWGDVIGPALSDSEGSKF